MIYEALVRAERTDPQSLREYLPAQLTRIGFPDIDWMSFFAAEPAKNLGDLVAELEETTRQRTS